MIHVEIKEIIRYCVSFFQLFLFYTEWCKLPGWNNKGWIPLGTKHADCRNPDNFCSTCSCVKAPEDKQARLLEWKDAGCNHKKPCGEPCVDSKQDPYYPPHVVGDKWDCYLTTKQLSYPFNFGIKVSF